jgi:O-antigen biosynthesis protein WbqL
MRLAPALPPLPPPKLLWSSPASAEASVRPRRPPTALFMFRDVTLDADWTPHHDGRPIADERIYPSYVAQWYANKFVDEGRYRLTPAPEMAGPSPAFVVSHFNMNVYGHFLLEVLPKLLVARELQRAGIRAPVILPSSQMWLARIAAWVVGSSGILFYQDPKHRLRIAQALLPSSQLALEGYDLHNTAASLLRTFVDELVLQRAAGRIPGPRIFLSRQKIRSYRKLANEPELAKVAADFGFELVHPQDMPWPDQVRMFASATHVIGEYTSALHNTLFCRPGAAVISLGWMAESGVQVSIAAVARNELGCVMPRNGELVRFDREWTEVQEFRIEADDLVDRLRFLGFSEAKQPHALSQVYPT